MHFVKIIWLNNYKKSRLYKIETALEIYIQQESGLFFKVLHTSDQSLYSLFWAGIIDRSTESAY